MMKKYGLLICLLPLVCTISIAQTGTGIPQNWDGTVLNDFRDSLRIHMGISLWYNESDFGMEKVNVAEDESDLDRVLDDSFGEKAGLRWINSRVCILLPGKGQTASLPDGFFSPEEVDKGLNFRVELEDDANSLPKKDKNEDLFSRIVDVGNIARAGNSGMAVLSGVITEKLSGEPVIGATVYTDDLKTGTVTNVSGTYFLKLPVGQRRIIVSYVGKKELFLIVNLYSDGVLNLQMEDKAMELKAVVVTSTKYHNIESTQMGVSRIDTRVFNSIPVIGEIDVLKVSMLLPGVQSVGEGTTGFNVRGGNTDQNLILFDKAPIFNPSHLMGFFSAFNAEIIRDFELHKSVIPAKLGGRLSSVMELNVKGGNKDHFEGSAGISPLTGKFHIEGPVIKNKLSFLAGGRSTYSDWILKRIKNPEISQSSASFYDLNLKADYEINPKNSLSLSAYFSDDVFSKSMDDTVFEYSNRSLNLEWKYKINPSLIKTSNLIYSGYNNSLKDVSSPERAYKTYYNIGYLELRTDFLYFLNNRHLVNFGFSNNLYKLLPGKLEKGTGISDIIPKTIENEQGMETSLYVGDEFRINSRLTLNAGLRYSLYNYLGPGKVFSYAEGLPFDISTLRDTLEYNSFESISSYHGPEPRLTLRYLLSTNLSLKAGYSRMRQNIHIMSNTFSVSPTDTWKLSDPNLGPQLADQISVGLYRNFKGGIIESSLEAYYKKIRGLKDYKVAATLMMNEHIETEIVDCRGRAYGIEFLLRKPSGKLNGWFTYTYSRILERSTGIYREEQINDNQWFPAIYDKPHSVSLVGSYRFSRRFSISSNLVYSTGRPITYPESKYNFRNGKFLHYSYRNEYRIDDYFRWDVSLNLDGNLRIDQIAHSYWSLSVYNVTGRDNIYSIFFVSGNNSVNGYKMSVFAEPIVSLSYNFRF